MLSCGSDHYQIIDALSDADAQLVGKDHTSERHASVLAPRSLLEEIVVVGEEHSSEFSGPVEEI